MNRREALSALGLGAAGIVALPRCAGPRPRTAGRDPGHLVERIRAAPRDGVFDVASDAIRNGADANTLLGAAFLAGIQDIRPRGVGGKFHAILMVESAFQLAEVSPRREALLAALFALWDFKRCQERDEDEEGDWVLPPRPAVSAASESAARRELLAAMEDWDAARADRAIVALVPHHDLDSMFELLWPLGARCYADLGHKIIFCAHAQRTLRRIGWRHAEPTLRSLVMGLLYEGSKGRETAVFESSQGLLESLDDGWLDGTEDPALSAELLLRLRDTDSAASQRIVVDAFRDGVGPATVWDGLRLHAVEVFHERPLAAARRHAPVHPVTELNAFAHAWRSTRSERTRKLMILQIAGWLAALRGDLVALFGEPRDAGLDSLGREHTGAVPDMRELFGQPSPGAARVRIDRESDGASRFLGQLRHFLFERAFQDHQYKLVAALHEEARSIHPRWASRLLAPCITYVPTACDPGTEVFERSVHALREAGHGTGELPAGDASAHAPLDDRR